MHSAFNAHLKQLYGHSQIAKFFVKYPPAPAALDILLQAWQRYKSSSEYWSQSTRSDPRYESPDVIHQRRELKRRVYTLRANRRLAIRYASYGTWGSWHTYDIVRRFRNGALDTELDQLTTQHGYGQLRTTDRYLSAPTVFGHASWPSQGR